MTDISAATSFSPLTDLGVLPASLPDPNANDLDRDAFLQLLVAQLRFQDPLNPNDPSEFMATTAQFTVVEKLEELTQQGANDAIVTGLSLASSLVGRSVSFDDADGNPLTAAVTAAQVVNGEVLLVTSEGIVDMSSVTAIGELPSAGTDETSTPTETPTDETEPATT